jgi:hypothetical protein
MSLNYVAFVVLLMWAPGWGVDPPFLCIGTYNTPTESTEPFCFHHQHNNNSLVLFYTIPIHLLLSPSHVTSSTAQHKPYSHLLCIHSSFTHKCKTKKNSLLLAPPFPPNGESGNEPGCGMGSCDDVIALYLGDDIIIMHFERLTFSDFRFLKSLSARALSSPYLLQNTIVPIHLLYNLPSISVMILSRDKIQSTPNGIHH